MFTTALMLVASLLTTAPTTTPTADLSVDLDAKASLVLPYVRYDVSITNHGPDPVTSATVVVQLEQRVIGRATPPCGFTAATKTLTCTFGTVPVGGTVTLSNSATYTSDSLHTVTVNAIATRTASTPTDPNPANDTDTRTCWVHGSFPPPPITC